MSHLSKQHPSNRLLLAALVLVLAASSSARAEEWSKTYSVTPRPELRVETTDANIHLETWGQSQIEARLTTERMAIGPDGVQVIEHQTGNTVEIEVHFPHMNWNIGFHRGSRVDLYIRMPHEGSANLHTGDGAITVTGLKGNIETRTGDGGQEFDAVDGVLRAKAGDGHIRAAGRFDGLDVGTGDGHIELRAFPGSTVASSWQVSAGDGSITLQLPENMPADVNLHTGDGHITLDMPLAVEGRLGRQDIHGKLNGGGNPVRVHTGDGSIRLEKLAAAL